ncbi:MAG: hypothetical protein ABGW69_02685 [Nanoarchaeota archaeon]
MIKLIKYSDFEEILDEIEEEVKNINELKENIVSNDYFYLNDLNKLEIKETVNLFDELIKIFEGGIEIEEK